MMEQNKPGMYRICARCPDKEEQDNIAKELNLPATHGICKECYQIISPMKNKVDFILVNE